MLLMIYNLRDAADLMIAVLAVLAIWVAYHKIPQKGIKEVKLPRIGAKMGSDQP